MNIINLAEYKDKVYGCWAGKNVGGTLGAPFEGRREMNEIDFYAQDLNGAPAPNDDLDLQLVWLAAIRRHGIANLTPRLLAEYWIGDINGPWNEYGIGKANMKAGLMPPLSGSCNNDRWKYSNGAWIRSEIWACCAPGDPDQAIKYAYMDACADHCGEGIYAEMFTAALESAAFIVSDLQELIAIGLSKLPADCRVTRSVNIAIKHHRDGKDWHEAREAIVKDSSDLGWFQAPANIAYTVLGLLYGEGDFGKTICRAVNCGDDTDCTGATAGSIMGIIGGRKAIPARWLKPIGEGIATCCINTFLRTPKTLDALTDEVTTETLKTHCSPAAPIQLADQPTSVDAAWRAQLTKTEAAAAVWAISPYELNFDLSYIDVVVDYVDGPELVPGVEKQVKVKISPKIHIYGQVFTMTWRLPEDWKCSPDKKVSCYMQHPVEVPFSITPGELEGGFHYVELEIKDRDRSNPTVLTIPFQKSGTVQFFPLPKN